MVCRALQEELGQDEEIPELKGLIWGPWQIGLSVGLNKCTCTLEKGKVYA